MKKNNRIKGNKYSELNYLLNRECLWCKTRIADQEHLSLKFCPKSYDENGKVKDCKTCYHRSKDQPIREIHSGIINNHKDFTAQFEQMIAKKGFVVDTQDLDAYDILLKECISYEIKSNGLLISKFIHHTVESNPSSKKHKITKHEQQSIDGKISKY